jgi:hypothetical protein
MEGKTLCSVLANSRSCGETMIQLTKDVVANRVVKVNAQGLVMSLYQLLQLRRRPQHMKATACYDMVVL